MGEDESRRTLKTRDGEKVGKIVKTLSSEDGGPAYVILLVGSFLLQIVPPFPTIVFQSEPIRRVSP